MLHRKFSVVAALIAAATVTAFADPPRWHDADQRDRYRAEERGSFQEGPRFHRARVDRYAADVQGGVVAQFDEPFDTRDGRGPITVDLGEGVPLHKLVIKSSGRSEVFNIVMQYADGGSHTYQWNHVFNAATSDGQEGHRLVTSGNGRVVQRILINGYNAPRTRLSVIVR